MNKSGIRITEEGDFKQYYSVKTVAKMFDVSEKTIRRLLQNRNLTIIRIGTNIRIPETELSKLFIEKPSTNTIMNKLLLD
ncbi:MAG: helix-turn-helix domain-containing protein [Bacteroidetes bacterium]|jgi:excisionase family DNA binding protein|nr:helix-turn-helix domain-containing protein [Bacteroidota bacterium]